MHGTLSGLIASYGYGFLFVLVAVESFGIPLPGETALVSAAAFAALGRLELLGVIAAAAAGAILGDTAGYWVGRKGGIALVRRYGQRVGLTETRLSQAQDFFARHGGKTVFIGRFVALLRSWAAALAGVSHMPYGAFFLYNALGGVSWAAVYGILGYIFGRNLPRLEHYAGQASLAAVLLIALTVGLALAAKWFHVNRGALAGRLGRVRDRLADQPRVARFRARHARLMGFVSARFARGEYLGLHLTGALAVSLLALWLFGGVTEDVVHHDPLTLFDVRMLAWVRTHADASGDRVALAVSALGSPGSMAALAVVVAAVFAVARRWVLLAGWTAAFAGAGILDWALKIIVQRPRPTGAEAFLHGQSFSFPSGHAMGSLVGYGMLAYILVGHWAKGGSSRVVLVAAAVILILAIGASRLYLGVHYFSDVVGGYAAGVVWLAGCISGVEIALAEKDPTAARAASNQRIGAASAPPAPARG